MTRQTQLYLLIPLSALTALPQYVMQGAMATGGQVQEFSQWFFVADYVMWGLRALIESWVIIYLFTTQARNASQGWFLGVLEVAIIALIAATLGPVLYALSGREALVVVLGGMRWLWAFGIAAYAPLLIGAAGYAYKVQPVDVNAQAKPLPKVEPVVATQTQGVTNVDEFKARLQQMSEMCLQNTTNDINDCDKALPVVEQVTTTQEPVTITGTEWKVRLQQMNGQRESLQQGLAQSKNKAQYLSEWLLSNGIQPPEKESTLRWWVKQV